MKTNIVEQQIENKIFYSIKKNIKEIFIKKNIEPEKKNNHESPLLKDIWQWENLARVWGEKHFRTWSENLSPEEKTALISLTEPSSQINTYLREFKKPIEKRKGMDQEAWNIVEKFNQIIDKVDNALLRAKTQTDLYLYRRVDATQFFSPKEIEKNSLILKSTTGQINRQLAKKIYNKFVKNETKYQDHGFVKASLSKDPTGLDYQTLRQPILLRIKIPKGTTAAFLEERKVSANNKQNEVLINRNYEFRYKKTLNNTLVITRDANHETLNIDLELILKNK